MGMMLIAGGDSFIHGSELADQKGGTPSSSTIPALLAKSIGAEYLCTAWPGNANNAIVRQVMNACELNKNQDLFVVVMWTFSHRYEFRFNYNTQRRNTPWYSMNLWDIVDDPATLKQEFVNFNPEVFDAHVKNKVVIDNVGITDFVKMFYKHVGNNEYYETYSTLKEILFLQQYLALNKIPYIFVPADTYLNGNDIYLRHEHDDSIRALYTQINWNNWYAFPPGAGKHETEHERGFYQWAIENKYKVGTTHPLEDAHRDAAELMQEKFNELVKKPVQ
jgi:hypothetical protein